jgi:hypothetical protein
MGLPNVMLTQIVVTFINKFFFLLVLNPPFLEFIFTFRTTPTFPINFVASNKICTVPL